MFEVLSAKMAPPEVEQGLLQRVRLFNMLTPDKEKRITVITAPAGYGKTVLARQLSVLWCKPLVWYHLDALDNDPAVFLQYMVTGIRQHCPGAGRLLNVSPENGNSESQRRLLTSILVNELVRSQGELLLVLDDYHEISNPSVHDLVFDFLENLPPNVYIIITGRTDPPFPLARLTASGTLRRIRTGELVFTRQEIKEYLEANHGNVSEDLLDKMESRTSGWAVALRFSAFDAFGVEFAESGKEPGSEGIYPYLASEIFNRQTPEIKDFLTATSVLDVLTPQICDLLLEREDSEQTLKVLYKRQMLLTPLAGSRNAFRYHQLFREFLRDRLGRRSRQLLRKAGRHALQLGELEHAVTYFLQSGFDGEAAVVLQKAGWEAFLRGRWQTVSLWLESLTEKQIAEYPWLSLFRARVEIYQGRLDEADCRVRWAASGFEADGDNSGLIEAMLLQARILRLRGSYRQGLEALEMARSRMSVQEAGKRFDISLEEGLGLALVGELPRAERIVVGALENARGSGDVAAAAHLAEALGHILYQQGEHARALKAYRQAMDASEGRSLPGYYMQDTIPYIYCDWGEMEKAMEWAEQSIASKEKYRFLETLHSAYTCISYIYFRLGSFDMVEQYAIKALELMETYGQERYYILLNRIILAWCRLMRGQGAEARYMLENVLKAADEQEDMIAPLVRMLAGTIMALMGSTSEAKAILHQAEQSMEKMNLRLRLCETYKALAYVYNVEEDKPRFKKYALNYVLLAARLNYVSSFTIPGDIMIQPILRLALEEGMETAFLQRILVKLGSNVTDMLLEMTRHPDQAVRYRVMIPLNEINGEEATLPDNAPFRDSHQQAAQAALTSAHQSQTASTAKLLDKDLSIGPGKAPLCINMLGSFRVLVNGNEILDWRTSKSRDLLALLAHIREPVSRDRIQEELWPDAVPEKVAKLFRTNLYYLRRLLDGKGGVPSFILYRHGKYQILETGYATDVQLFEQCVNAGLKYADPGAVEIGYLEKAVNLYRGHYMEGLDDYTWVIPRQFRLKQLYMESLLAMAEYYFSRKAYSMAEVNLLKIKETDPAYEQAHRLLLKVYAGLGNYRELHEQYRSFKQLLTEEYGLSPSTETESLYRQLSRTG